MIPVVIDFVGSNARIAGIVGFDQFHQGAAPVVAAFLYIVQVDFCVVQHHVGIPVVGGAGFDLYGGVFRVDGGILDADGTAGVLLGHDGDPPGGQLGIRIIGGRCAGSHDLHVIRTVEFGLFDFVMHAGVRVGHVAGSFHGIAVLCAVDSLGGRVFFAVFCFFHAADAGGYIGGFDGVLPVVFLIRSAGIGGKHAPAGGYHQGIAVESLGTAENVGGAHSSLYAQREGRTFHHGNHEGIVLVVGVIAFFRVDHRVVDF